MLLRLIRPSLVLCAVGSVVGLAINATSTHGVALGTPVYPSSASATVCADPTAAPVPVDHPRIALDDAISRCEACSAGFVDARGAVAFAHGHITNAFHLPPEKHENVDALFEKLRGFSTLIVYDDDARCALAQGVADRLVVAGFTDVRVLDGNWSAWEAARGPAQAGVCETCAHAPSSTESL